MDFPKSIKIGAINYDVVVVDKINEKDVLGETVFTEQLIRIKRGKKSIMWTTLFHEMFHGINCVFSEFEAETLANSIFQILTENSKIFKLFNKG